MQTLEIPDEWWRSRRQSLPDRLREVLERGRELGFIGPMELGEQIDHALGFVRVIESTGERPPRRVLDLGTGGGLPGLVLAASWPETSVVFVEANRRRADFLGDALERIRGLRAEVEAGRAEVLGRSPGLRETFEVVTARSFGPPAVTAECGAPFLEVGGRLVVSDAPEAGGDDRWPPAGTASLGLGAAQPVRAGGRFAYRFMEKVEPVSDRYPRRTGVPSKRPLF